MNIPQPNGGFIDEILTVAGTIIPAGNRHSVLVKGQPSALVVDGEGHLCKTLRLSGWRTTEHHVLHFHAAQRLGGLLAQHPSHCVTDVTFAAAVWPDNRRNTIFKGQLRLIRKGLEAM